MGLENLNGRPIDYINDESGERKSIQPPKAPVVEEPEIPSILKDIEDDFNDVSETYRKRLEELEAQKKELEEIKKEQEAKFEKTKKDFEANFDFENSGESAKLVKDEFSEQFKDLSARLEDLYGDTPKGLNK